MLNLRTAAAILVCILAPLAGSGCKSSAPADADAASTGEGTAKEPPQDVKLPGIDTSVLTPRERREFSGYVTEFLAPCPEVPVSIAQCVTEKRDCGACVPAAKWLVRQVQNGRPRESIEKGYKSRYDPSAVKKIPVEGSPSIGPDSAKVTLVEFADFECPGCAALMPALDKVLEQHKDVRLVYKVVVLSSHLHAEPAARAALAAHAQGKFWEMHHLLFQNQMRLEQADLERYARMLNLDMARFKADFESDAVKEKIEKDRQLGTELKIDHTPTVYLNGREVEPLDELGEWIAAELGESSGHGADAGGDAAAVDSGAKGGDDGGNAPAPSGKPAGTKHP